MLSEIIQNKLKEIAALKESIDTKSINQNSSKKRHFYKNLLKNQKIKKNSIIAEIKKRSPSKGILNNDLNPSKLAQEYQKGGATCLSVLTEKDYFNGSNNDLISARQSVNIPVLRKDFILDPIQLYESKKLGADCILLILSALKEEMFENLLDISNSLNLDVLVEVHDYEELKIALAHNVSMVGINNRNLKTFDVSLKTSIELAETFIDDDIVLVSESGINTPEDILQLNNANIYSFLIGEHLVKSKNKAKRMGELINV